MSKENLAFLFGGFAFGVLIGLALYGVLFGASGGVPALPPAPAQAPGAGAPRPPMGQGGGGAPMVAEVNRLKTLLQSDPNNLDALVRLANIHHDVSMWDQAIGYYERAIAISPNDPNLLTDMGISYRGLKQPDRALELFDQAQAIDPKHWQSLFNIVIVATFDTTDFERAEAALAKMEALDPQPPQLADLRHVVEKAREGS